MEAITCDVEGVASSDLLSPVHSVVTLSAASCAFLFGFQKLKYYILGPGHLPLPSLQHYLHYTVQLENANDFINCKLIF